MGAAEGMSGTRICSNSHADESTFHFWNPFTQYHKIINIVSSIGFQGARCILSNVGPFLPAKYAKETRYGYSTQTVSPILRGNKNVLAEAKAPCSSSTHAPPPGWFPRNLGSARLKPHQQQKPLKVKAAALKVGQIEGEAYFTTILSLGLFLY